MAKLTVYCVLLVHLIFAGPALADDVSIECFFCATMPVPPILPPQFHPLVENIPVDPKCAGKQATEFLKPVKEDNDEGGHDQTKKDGYCVTVEGPAGAFVARTHRLLTDQEHKDLNLEDGCHMVVNVKICYCEHDKCNGDSKPFNGGGAAPASTSSAPPEEEGYFNVTTEPTTQRPMPSSPPTSSIPDTKNNKGGKNETKATGLSAGLLGIDLMAIVVQLVVAFIL